MQEVANCAIMKHYVTYEFDAQNRSLMKATACFYIAGFL